MKALLFNGKEKISYTNIPKPKIGAHDVLMKIKAVGICGTDLHIYRGGLIVPKKNVIGHEFSGIVSAIGHEVHNVKIGDHVVGEHVVSCRKCFYCKHGKPNLCSNAQIIGLQRPGALAEFLSIPSNLVYKISNAIPFTVAALVEPLSIALYAVREAGFLLNKRVAVVGQGPIGLLVDQVLTSAGALVTGIDIRNDALSFAKKKGWVRHTIHTTNQNPAERVKKITPDGYDIVFEVVGLESTTELAMEIARRNAKVFLLGVFSTPSKINMMNIVKKELRVFGSWTCANVFPETIELIERNEVDLKSLITHTYKAKDGVKAFAEANIYAGHRIKSVIIF